MKVLRFIHISLASAFYAWALREINPLHQDVPRIVLRQRELQDQSRDLLT